MVAAMAATLLPLGSVAIGVVGTGGEFGSTAVDAI